MSELFHFELADLWAIPLLVILWVGVLWSLYELGCYEYTGMRGWRRIIAGWRLFLLLVEQAIKRNFPPPSAPPEA